MRRSADRCEGVIDQNRQLSVALEQVLDVRRFLRREGHIFAAFPGIWELVQFPPPPLGKLRITQCFHCFINENTGCLRSDASGRTRALRCICVAFLVACCGVKILNSRKQVAFSGKLLCVA